MAANNKTKEEVKDTVEEIRPMNDKDANACVIETLEALTNSLRQQNEVLADLLREKAEAEKARALNAPYENVEIYGRPDDYTGEAWQKKVKVRLFKDDGKYKDDLYIAVNGRRYRIKRGVDVNVPLADAAALEEHETQTRATALLISEYEAEAEAREAELV